MNCNHFCCSCYRISNIPRCHLHRMHNIYCNQIYFGNVYYYLEHWSLVHSVSYNADTAASNTAIVFNAVKQTAVTNTAVINTTGICSLLPWTLISVTFCLVRCRHWIHVQCNHSYIQYIFMLLRLQYIPLYVLHSILHQWQSKA